MKHVWQKITNRMNDYRIGKKLAILYILCVILPLALTDGIIFVLVSSRAGNDQKIDMENHCRAVEADIQFTMDEVVEVTNDLYTNKTLHQFLIESYDTPMHYFEARYDFLEKVPLEMLQGGSIKTVSFYTDNDTIINGGSVYQLADAKKLPWYRPELLEERSVYTPVSYFAYYYVGDSFPTASIKRRFSYIRALSFFKDSDKVQLVQVDIDYNTMVKKLSNLHCPYTILVCHDNTILYSNKGFSNNTQDFYELTGDERIGYEKTVQLPGETLRIVCLKESTSLQKEIAGYWWLFLFLLATNLLIPIIMGKLFYNSFVTRLETLSFAFDKANADSLHEIGEIQGKDEIGALMENYNYMARRINELIRTVYTDRLEKQEMDIERQNAELLALQSQINPHFLFNVLESIRMHCLLKQETETAHMIERLAILERQNVDWVSDYITVEKEMQFIDAYLDLQQYRFGDRFHFEIDMEDQTREYLIPKLTLVTFVENACVHGIEKKAADCWIYVRTFEKNEEFILEIEDTGSGMEDEIVDHMKELMANCTIDDLKSNTHVGIINACLRLHMMTGRRVQFEVESEVGVGTFTAIRIPVDCAVNHDKG